MGETAESSRNSASSNHYRWVSLTTDYGLRDGFVAACRGVLASTAPHVNTIDISHDVPAQDVRAGASILAQTVPYLPTSVHLVVVDPGVGTTRRGVLVVAERGVLVGPDNGVLLPAADSLGGPRQAVELNEPQWWLSGVSRTFHGRDIFAPVAGWLAAGTPPERFGGQLAVDELVAPPTSLSTVDGQRVRAEVVLVDHFGNLQLAIRGDQLPWHNPPRLQLRAGNTHRQVSWARTFADVATGEPLALVDSAGRLALAVNTGSAAQHLGLNRGDIVELEPDRTADTNAHHTRSAQP